MVSNNGAEVQARPWCWTEQVDYFGSQTSNQTLLVRWAMLSPCSMLACAGSGPCSTCRKVSVQTQKHTFRRWLSSFTFFWSSWIHQHIVPSLERYARYPRNRPAAKCDWRWPQIANHNRGPKRVFRLFTVSTMGKSWILQAWIGWRLQLICSYFGCLDCFRDISLKHFDLLWTKEVVRSVVYDAQEQKQAEPADRSRLDAECLTFSC